MRHLRGKLAVVAVSAVAILAGCTNPADTTGSGDTRLHGKVAAQKIAGKSESTCTDSAPGDGDLSDVVVGFSQSQSEENPFRATETASIKAAAKKYGVQKLLYANADDNQADQVTDIKNMISNGAEALIVAPVNTTGLQPAFAAARAKNIPVVLIDRETAGKVCRDFITFMGSDFTEQGTRAARALVEATGGDARVAEVQGAYGNNVVTERTRGFAKVVQKHQDVQIVAQQTANWSTSEAQRVVSQILAAHPEVNAVYTHSDTMALGALAAVRYSGKKPGEDVQIVSIDGTAAVVDKIVAGKIHATIETNPRFGPAAFDALSKWFAGDPVSQSIIMKDRLFTEKNAKKALESGAAYGG